ncbi:hypothetical protein HHI36_020907 [Cryptolaemus montrouzieri]|uniref:Uncharacterized protein n=1 Tax=Cryptolaemus montrouzieri TaxID=559131 RepID=A0ABD2NC91_9CUCU
MLRHGGTIADQQYSTTGRDREHTHITASVDSSGLDDVTLETMHARFGGAERSILAATTTTRAVVATAADWTGANDFDPTCAPFGVRRARAGSTEFVTRFHEKIIREKKTSSKALAKLGAIAADYVEKQTMERLRVFL